MGKAEEVKRQLEAGLVDARRQAANYAATSVDRIRAAAVHEAGHAVVGALNGERIGEIVLCPPAGDETEWGGHTVREAGSADLNQQVQAALAGDAAEGNQSFDRDRKKATDVLAHHTVEEHEVNSHLERGWEEAKEAIDAHRVAVNALADLVASDVASAKHYHHSGENTRAKLEELLDRKIEAPLGGDSEPCDCTSLNH
jgi:hypothetical protein